MSKLALLICSDDPAKPSSSSADAAAFKRAICKYWGFNDSEIVFLASNGQGDEPPTRGAVTEQFSKAAKGENLDSLIVGFWGYGVHEPGQNKRRLCLSEFDFSADPASWAENIKDTTVSLASLLSATLKLHARDAVFVIDCRPLNSEGKPWTIDVEDCQTMRKFVRKTEPGYRFAVLAACSDGEAPRDIDEGRKGVFTAKLIDGIRDSADRYQGSFDSVSGYAVQRTKDEAAKLGVRQFPLSDCAGYGDIRFEITEGYSANEYFDAYEVVEETEPMSELADVSLVVDSSGGEKGKKKKNLILVGVIAAALLAASLAGVGVWMYLR